MLFAKSFIGFLMFGTMRMLLAESFMKLSGLILMFGTKKCAIRQKGKSDKSKI
jgi:hypothetical protein